MENLIRNIKAFGEYIFRCFFIAQKEFYKMGKTTLIILTILITVILFISSTFLYGKILKAIISIDDAIAGMLDKLIGE